MGVKERAKQIRKKTGISPDVQPLFEERVIEKPGFSGMKAAKYNTPSNTITASPDVSDEMLAHELTHAQQSTVAKSMDTVPGSDALPLFRNENPTDPRHSAPENVTGPMRKEQLSDLNKEQLDIALRTLLRDNLKTEEARMVEQGNPPSVSVDSIMEFQDKFRDRIMKMQQPAKKNKKLK